MIVKLRSASIATCLLNKKEERMPKLKHNTKRGVNDNENENINDNAGLLAKGPPSLNCRIVV